MVEGRNYLTTASVVVAVLCAGWAIYVTKRADRPPAFGPPGMAGGPGFGAGTPGQGAASGAARPDAPGGEARGQRPGGGGPPGMGGTPGMGGRGGPTNVVSAEVKLEELARELKAIGTARANEAVDITAKSSNLVTAVRFQDGQRVARGDVLVELDSAQARADLAAADAALTESRSLFERSSELMKTQAVSKSQFDQIEATKKANAARVAAARAKLEDTVIRAPFAGRIGLRRVSVGSLVNPGAVITTLDDTSVMKVDFAVPENSVAALRADLAVRVQTSAYPARTFEGKVASVDSRVDPSTRSVTVRALLPNAEGLLRPGMFLNVTLLKDERSALVVPEEALVPEQDRQYVFVVADGTAARREVQIGARRPGLVEIVAGVRRGERVIVEGTGKVRDGGAVRDLAAGTPPGGPGGQPPAGALAGPRGGGAAGGVR
jgi:membrane fusion protein (multidrug efflux system)